MVVLLGYMGSGKSAVGRALANRMHVKFIDFDEYIEAGEGLSIVDLFKSKGEIYFRKAESKYLDLLLQEKPEAVVALGGGTPCYGTNMQMLLESGVPVIYLHVNIPNLVERLKKEKEQRPLIAQQNDDDLAEFIGKHLFERNPFYQQATYTVNASNKSIGSIATEIERLLQ